MWPSPNMRFTNELKYNVVDIINSKRYTFLIKKYIFTYKNNLRVTKKKKNEFWKNYKIDGIF